MNSRMERYNNSDVLEKEENAPVRSRVSRNNSLYQDIKTNELTRVRSNDNIKVIENSGNTINLDKIRRYITEINEQPSRMTRKSVRVEQLEETDVEEKVKEEVPKDYDINSVLDKAKRSREIDYDRERYKKLRDTQYDILNKLDTYDSKEDELIDNLEESFNTDERNVIDLINTVTIHKGEVNLLEELMGDDEEDRTDPIEEEIMKDDIKNEVVKELEQREESIDDNYDKTRELASLKDKTMKIDNSFYTNSMSFSKDDFEGFDELEKSVKKSGVFTTILIVILVIFIIATLVVMGNYVFDLGLF